MPEPDLVNYSKLIVGEGRGDFHFFQNFCPSNGLEKFDYAHTQDGFSSFGKYLSGLEANTHFRNLTDIVLVIDSTDKPDRPLKLLHRQIKAANKTIGSDPAVYDEKPNANQIATAGNPRLHVLRLPIEGEGGLETICFDAARDHCEAVHGRGLELEGWVDSFANSACKKWNDDSPWTKERRDKLRLQSFMSAAWWQSPATDLTRIFRDARDKIISLTSPAYEPIKDFLKKVEAL